MTTTYRVEGMTCQGCAKAVANAIQAAAPGSAVDVDLAGGRVMVQGADAGRVRDAVEGAGFTYAGVASGG